MDVNLSNIRTFPSSVFIVLYLISLIFCKTTKESEVKIRMFIKKKRFLIEKKLLYLSRLASKLIIFSNKREDYDLFSN